jgi:elongation factor P--(R)-beta-lysine ligase
VLRGPSGVAIADAFASVRVELAAREAPASRTESDGGALLHASIAIIEGTLEASALVDAIVIEEQPNASGALPAEFERLTSGGVGPALQQRARIIAAVRRFFTADGFLEIDAPLMSPESATEAHIEPLTASGGYLITSPELHLKRLLAGGVPKLFQLGHCFRAEELGAWHSPEFTLLEWYRAFETYEEVMRDTERLLAALCCDIHGAPRLELANGARIDLTPPFLRLSLREAFARHAGVPDAAALAAEDEDAYFQLLVDRVEPALAAYPKPVFLCEYPVSQAALARRSPRDASVAERFELYLGGIELCNGYGELTDAAEQRARCELDRERRRALGRPVLAMPNAFLAALERGMPPASGNAVGLDRVIALLLGRGRIDDVRPFADADSARIKSEPD